MITIFDRIRRIKEMMDDELYEVDSRRQSADAIVQAWCLHDGSLQVLEDAICRMKVNSLA